MKKRILITGGKGLTGKAITRILSPFYNVYAFGRQELDVTKPGLLHKTASLARPDYIIHLAAYTQVDLAEKEQKKAYAVNVKGTENIMSVARKYNSILVFLSTDYVFDGEKGKPYVETDPKNPVNYYGYTKSLAEDLIMEQAKKYFIIRPAWIFGEDKRNFIHLVLDLAQKNKTLRFVSDQISTPTYTKDLAFFIKYLIDMEEDRYGIYHYTNEGQASRYDEAQFILETLGIDRKIIPVSREEFPAPAKRPPYSVLSKEKIRNLFRIAPRDWKEAMKECLQNMFPGENIS